MPPIFINVNNQENETIVSRFISTENGKNKNTVHVHSSLSSIMTLAASSVVFISSVTPSIPIQIHGERIRLKNVNVIKSNLLRLRHTSSGQFSDFSYPNSLFYNYETLMVGVSSEVVQPHNTPVSFITQNSFVVPLLNRATLNQVGLNFHLNEVYDLENNRSFFNIWLRNESGAGSNDIENMVSVVTLGMAIVGYTIQQFQFNYGIFATFEIE